MRMQTGLAPPPSSAGLRLGEPPPLPPPGPVSPPPPPPPSPGGSLGAAQIGVADRGVPAHSGLLSSDGWASPPPLSGAFSLPSSGAHMGRDWRATGVPEHTGLLPSPLPGPPGLSPSAAKAPAAPNTVSAPAANMIVSLRLLLLSMSELLIPAERAVGLGRFVAFRPLPLDLPGKPRQPPFPAIGKESLQ